MVNRWRTPAARLKVRTGEAEQRHGPWYVPFLVCGGVIRNLRRIGEGRVVLPICFYDKESRRHARHPVTGRAIPSSPVTLGAATRMARIRRESVRIMH
jgi:hypothetical protein